MSKSIIVAKDDLKIYRLSNGITREELAKAAECTPEYIGMIENGDCGCGPKVAQAIVTHLNKKFQNMFEIR